jgi:(2Fe-2S) ferredoxin
MAPPFEKHVFICTNRRPDGHPKGCCATKGGEEVRSLFKEELHKRGLKARMRANAAGCLDTCPLGVTVVVYPEGVWYGHVTREDVVPIIEEHLLGGRPLERLRIDRPRAEAARTGAARNDEREDAPVKATPPAA